MIKSAIIISAFCGTGKTYLCNTSDRFVEFECWKYDKDNFPENCLVDIKSNIHKVDIIFISTNPTVLIPIVKMGITVILIYPNLKLKDEYINRYKKRGSSNDFISTLSKNWERWLIEIGGLGGCQHIILKRRQYVSTVLATLSQKK